jgi:hypothetical protein
MSVLIYGFSSINVADGDSLKEIDGVSLSNGYMAFGVHDGKFYSYRLDS